MINQKCTQINQYFTITICMDGWIDIIEVLEMELMSETGSYCYVVNLYVNGPKHPLSLYMSSRLHEQTGRTNRD